jgi:preprotein translocase subunit YajC
MKLIAQFGLISFLTLSAASALACPHSRQEFICPGDTVVDSSGYQGRVAAVNPFQKTAAVNYGGSTNENHEYANLALGVGCIDGVCVGDRVVDSSGYAGHVVGVNPYNDTLAINYGGSTSELHEVNDVALGQGCILGYCVGDKVVDSSGYSGEIIAVNFATGTAAVNYGGSTSELHEIQTLSTSVYCDKYGDSFRGMKRFPLAPVGKYLGPNFHYHSAR